MTQQVQDERLEAHAERFGEVLLDARDNKRTGWFGVEVLFANGVPQTRRVKFDATEK